MSHERTVEVVQLGSTLIQSTKLAFKLGAAELKSSTCQVHNVKSTSQRLLGMATMIISQHTRRGKGMKSKQNVIIHLLKPP